MVPLYRALPFATASPFGRAGRSRGQAGPSLLAWLSLRSLVAVCLVAGLPVVLVFLAAVFFSSVFPGPWGLVALRSLGLVFSPPWSLAPALVFVPAPSVLGGWCWAGPLLSAFAVSAAFAPGLLARDLVGGLALPVGFASFLLLLGSSS